MTLRNILVTVQTLTFIGLGLLLLHNREWRLGAAQCLLGVVTWLVYSA